jgi:hypothetical protein
MHASCSTTLHLLLPLLEFQGTLTHKVTQRGILIDRLKSKGVAQPCISLCWVTELQGMINRDCH